MLWKASIFLLLPALGCAADGLTPRPTPADYPVHQTTADNTAIAAAFPTREVLKRSFSADLTHDWLVVEVAVYPGDNNVKLKPENFILRVHDRDTVAVLHPVEPRDVAQSERPAPERPQFGQTHGSVGYDTVIGGGIHAQSVGGEIHGPVDVSPSPAPDTGGRDELSSELSARAFPYGAATSPVAGFLYFPLHLKKHAKPRYELEYTTREASVTLELANAPR